MPSLRKGLQPVAASRQWGAAFLALLPMILLLVLPTAAAGMQQQDDYRYHGPTQDLVARGTQALELCNGIFTSKLTADQVYSEDLLTLGAGELVPRSRVQIEHGRRAVAVGTGSGDAIPTMRAAYREGLGCIIMAPDQTFDDIASLPELRTPPPPGDPATIPWPDGDVVEPAPLAAGVNGDVLAAAGDWAFDRVAHGGNSGQFTTSLLVVHRGKIVLERYAPGLDMSTRTRTWSTAKSITSTVIGVAVDKGLLSLDEPLPIAWIPEASRQHDPRKAITLRHVLHMASGLYPIDNEYNDIVGSTVSYFAGTSAAYGARNRGLVAQPGTVMDYENYDSILALIALRAVLGDPAYHEFPRLAVFDRIGMRNTVAGVDRFGDFILSSQVYTNSRDIARLGLLYLNRGKWNGEQVLSEEWIDFVRTPSPLTRGDGNGYGGHFWLVPDARTDLPQDAYATSGARGQYTIIVPSHDLVIVRRAWDERGGNRPGLSQWDLLGEVLKAFPRNSDGRKHTSTSGR